MQQLFTAIPDQTARRSAARHNKGASAGVRPLREYPDAVDRIRVRLIHENDG